jgi:hypothetical protein
LTFSGKWLALRVNGWLPWHSFKCETTHKVVSNPRNFLPRCQLCFQNVCIRLKQLLHKKFKKSLTGPKFFPGDTQQLPILHFDTLDSDVRDHLKQTFFLRGQSRVARWFIFKPKIPVWVIIYGPRLENVETFYVHLLYLADVWDILWPFGTFRVNLVHFFVFGIVYQEKSGNPGTKRNVYRNFVYGSKFFGRR